MHSDRAWLSSQRVSGCLSFKSLALGSSGSLSLPYPTDLNCCISAPGELHLGKKYPKSWARPIASSLAWWQLVGSRTDLYFGLSGFGLTHYEQNVPFSLTRSSDLPSWVSPDLKWLKVLSS